MSPKIQHVSPNSPHISSKRHHISQISQLISPHRATTSHQSATTSPQWAPTSPPKGPPHHTKEPPYSLRVTCTNFWTASRRCRSTTIHWAHSPTIRTSRLMDLILRYDWWIDLHNFNAAQLPIFSQLSITSKFVRYQYFIIIFSCFFKHWTL